MMSSCKDIELALRKRGYPPMEQLNAAKRR